LSLKLYLDVHVNDAITRGLRRRGVDVLRAQDDGAATLPDPKLLDRATELGRVLFTQDEDFLAEASYRQSSDKTFAGVIYAHQRGITIGQCIAELELLAKLCDLDEMANSVTYLPF
jgi:hypothetical protein